MYLLFISLFASLSHAADVDIIKLLKEASQGKAFQPVLSSSVSRMAFTYANPEDRYLATIEQEKEERKRAQQLCGYRKLVDWKSAALDRKAGVVISDTEGKIPDQVKALDFIKDQPGKLGEVSVQLERLPYISQRPELGAFSSGLLKLIKGTGVVFTLIGLPTLVIERATGMAFIITGQLLYHFAKWGLDRKYSYNDFKKADPANAVVKEFYETEKGALKPDHLKYRLSAHSALTKEQFESQQMAHNFYFTEIICSGSDGSPLVEYYKDTFVNPDQSAIVQTRELKKTWSALNPFAWYRKYRSNRALPAQ